MNGDINWLGKILKIAAWSLIGTLFLALKACNTPRQFEAGIGLGWCAAMILCEMAVWAVEYMMKMRLYKLQLQLEKCEDALQEYKQAWQQAIRERDQHDG